MLDEPTIGLHPRDNRRLLDALAALRDLGNTLVVVEHDRETLQEADYIVDMGPGAGREGGEVVASGSPSAVQDAPNSQTGAYLRDELHIDVPTKRRKGKERNSSCAAFGKTTCATSTSPFPWANS